MMCGVCGDVIRFTGWVQLSLDESYSVWFTGAECLCGYSVYEAKVVESVHDEA